MTSQSTDLETSMKQTYPFTRANVDETLDKVYEYIVEYITVNTYAPSVRDICAGVGLRSTSTAYSHLKRLVDDGRIEMDAGKRRAIRVPALDTADTVSIPLVGTVTAGRPILATENIEQTLVLPSPFGQDADSLFALRIKGDSMIDAGIHDDDIVFVEKTPVASNGQIIVALLEDEATVKRFYKENGHFRLQPENDTYEPIICNELIILGKVVGLVRYY